jgi:superfamily II DNA or RNA helicase
VGKRVLFLVHMDELINDVMERAVAIEPALYVGKVKAKLNEIDRHAVFASVQSLKGKRLDDLGDKEGGVGIAGRFDYVITDEAHHAPARSYRAIYDRIAKVNPGWRHVLLTATPFRNAGGGKTEGLGVVVRRLAYEYSLSDAIAEGALCPLRGIKVRTEIDLTGVDPDDEDAIEKLIDTPSRNRVVAETYVAHCVEGGERREYTVTETWTDDTGEHTEEVTRTLVRGGNRKQAIVFACTIAHAQRIAAELVKWGIVSEHVYGVDKERTRKIEAFKAGRIDVICNNNLLSEGFDHKPTGAVLLVRPTQSRGLYAQQVGRATRKYLGKNEGLVIDFVANSDTHSLASLADLTRPEQDLPRIEPGAEVRHRRDAAKSKGLVESIAGWLSNDEQGTALVLWKQGSADLGIVATEPVEEETRNLVLVKPPVKARDEDEVVINPTVIGVNEFSISLFGEPTGGKRIGWYTYTDSSKHKHLVARGKGGGESAMIRHHSGGDDREWEAWRRKGDTISRVRVGTFAECEQAVADMKPDDYTAEWLRKPASEKQIETLAKFGVRRSGLSRGEASMILELKIMAMRISKGQYAPEAPPVLLGRWREAMAAANAVASSDKNPDDYTSATPDEEAYVRSGREAAAVAHINSNDPDDVAQETYDRPTFYGNVP